MRRVGTSTLLISPGRSASQAPLPRSRFVSLRQPVLLPRCSLTSRALLRSCSKIICQSIKIREPNSHCLCMLKIGCRKPPESFVRHSSEYFNAENVLGLTDPFRLSHQARRKSLSSGLLHLRRRRRIWRYLDACHNCLRIFRSISLPIMEASSTSGGGSKRGFPKNKSFASMTLSLA